MDERGRARRQGEAFGLESVAKVEDALRNHTRIFESFSRTEPGGDRDREGVDIEVNLARGGRLANFDKFSIEVKSGRTGTLNFLVKAAMRVPAARIKAIGIDGAVVEHLFKQKKVLVMAGDDLETDVRLMEQYNALHSYWHKLGQKESPDEMFSGLFFRFFSFTEKQLWEAVRDVAARK